MRKRITRPTAISSPDRRNGTRHPQAVKAGSGTSPRASQNTRVEASSPSGTPACGQLA